MKNSKIKIAYFDCQSGISGNMILGALIDSGVKENELKKELKKLQLANGPSTSLRASKLQIAKMKKQGLVGTHVKVKVIGKEKPRSLKEILSIINKSSLDKSVKEKSKKIFERLAAAEAKVHGEKIGNVHLHDVGSTDAIIDIVGAVIGLEKLGIEKVYCSPVHVGKGKIKYVHGDLPVPAPATAELLKGMQIYSEDIKGELTTPTGAAIISTLAESFGPLPRFKVESLGYGAGTKNLDIPNMLRVFIGEMDHNYNKDSVLQIETNIDDMNPKYFDNAIKNIMKAGALDAYITPIRMKKNRYAITLTALLKPDKKDEVLKAIFDETTTLGVRIFLVGREKLKRETRKVKTRIGQIRVKIGKVKEKVKNLAPEYEDLKKLSRKYKIPIGKVFSSFKKAISLVSKRS